MSLTLIPLSGFLGAGKTTAMVAAARLLESSGRTVALITNDQGTDLVDTATARSRGALVDEVTGGCFCCRFDDLAALVDRIAAGGTVDTVMIEAVGSCTDLQATVVRPLRQIYGDALVVAPLTTVVDPFRLQAFSAAWAAGEDSELAYLFDHQLAEADVIAVSKTDVAGPARTGSAVEAVRARYPRARVVPCSSVTGDGLDALVDAWAEPSAAAWDVPIDYDRYAAAEAGLAWLNQRFVVAGVDGDAFDAELWSRTLMETLREACDAAGHVVGHVKLRTTTPAGDVKISLVGGGSVLDETVDEPATQATAVLNTRVECEPEQMDAMLTAAVQAADLLAVSTTVRDGAAVSFKPGYPTPVHRVPAAASAHA
ncbi:GTP-binding protein [Cellulomonas sp. SLBN-39]|uniref:GTP-binding protein n=1 Tax=Cellulomonas sp. SLBN-39 TaxID=2768446 RepID=UPI00114F8BE6|nr:GTP-binding protein [Cellulomonas sp. SLBN-39]TQL03089.1 CobW/HypB/UreG family nucleotide-binding protein [Cellulomonas sp. SLBN-39]